jgi:hypothetical protein
MLGTGSRFAEYGITGGFFLLVHTLAFVFLFPDMLTDGTEALGTYLTALVNGVPPEIRPALQSLLIAMALLSVFIVGLLLDILGALLMLFEAWIFQRQLVKNQGWIESFVQSELPHFARDYFLTLNLAQRINPLKLAEFAERSRMWLPERRSAGFYLVRVYRNGFRWQRRTQQAFRRLEHALIARVLASGAKIEMLTEQLSICRMSRAIAAALYVLAIELFYAMILTMHQSGWRFFWGYLWAFVFGGLALLIGTGAYSRFTMVLFAMVYATIKRERA